MCLRCELILPMGAVVTLHPRMYCYSRGWTAIGRAIPEILFTALHRNMHAMHCSVIQCIPVQCMSRRNSVDCLQGIIQRTAQCYSYNTVLCWVQRGYRVSPSIPPLSSLDCSTLYSVNYMVHSVQCIMYRTQCTVYRMQCSPLLTLHCQGCCH